MGVTDDDEENETLEVSREEERSVKEGVTLVNIVFEEEESKEPDKEEDSRDSEEE